MSDFEVMPPGSGRVLRQALQQLERGFAAQNHPEQKLGLVGAARQALEAMEGELPGWRTPAQAKAIIALRAELAHYEQQQEQEPGVCGRCGGLVYDPVVVQQKQEPVAWRFRTAGIEHAAWRLTDDAGLVEQMRKLGHWDIRPLGELPAEGGGK